MMKSVTRQRRRSPRSRVLIASALALLLVAAGCGSDDGEPEAEEPTQEEPEAEEPEAEEPEAEEPGAEEPAGDYPDLPQTSLVVGGSGSGGGAFIAGGTMAEWVNQNPNLEALDLTNQATGGFVENIRLLSFGELDLGMVSTNLLSNAFNSEKAFEGEDGFDNIRILFPIWGQFGVMGTFDDDVTSVTDLEGRPVNVGPGGSATQEVSRALLEGAGIIDSVQIDQQDWAEGVRLMQDGLVDAFGIMGPAPFPAIQEAAASPGQNFRLIDTSDIAEQAQALAPEFIVVTMPVDAHGPGLPDVEYQTIGAVAYLAVTADMDDDIAYALTKSMMTDEGIQYLTNGYAGFNFTVGADFAELSGLADVGVNAPLHPGAVRYWEETGLTIPDNIKG